MENTVVKTSKNGAILTKLSVWQSAKTKTPHVFNSQNRNLKYTRYGLLSIASKDNVRCLSCCQYFNSKQAATEHICLDEEEFRQFTGRIFINLIDIDIVDNSVQNNLSESILNNENNKGVIIPTAEEFILFITKLVLANKDTKEEISLLNKRIIEMKGEIVVLTREKEMYKNELSKFRQGKLSAEYTEIYKDTMKR